MRIGKLDFISTANEVVEELRNQLHINEIQLLQKQPIDGPSNIQIQCPYHGNGQERRPSAGIKKSDGVFHCFACGETHSLPELISFCFGYNDEGAYGWGWLLKNFMSISPSDRRDIKLDVSRNTDSNDVGAEKFVTEEELDSYRYYHPYWEKRGIVDEDIIELFDLGYDKNTKSITFPIRDIDGNCLFVARRSVLTKFFNYPEGVEKPLYGLYEIYCISNEQIKSPSTGEFHKLGFPSSIIVCESMIDCILLWQAGHFTVALNGLGNELQMQQLRDLPCRHIILATDNDKAGKDARDKIKKKVTNKLISEIIFPDDIKDIGECTPEEILNVRDWEEY